ncbi:MAG: MATE family efflux transporter [Lachnospiraceae bacterium]
MKVRNMSQDERVRYMTTEPIPGLICQMAVPTIISMLVTAFYNMADTLFVGRLNTQSTAAVGVAFSVMALIQACGFFFGHGSGNYISRSLGAREYEDAEKMASTGFFLAIITGIVITVCGVIFIEPISVLLGSTPTILPYTEEYLRVIFLGTPLIMGSFVLNNQLRFQGSASVAMIGIVSGALLNVVLDPILIFLCDLGVAGAAWATVISQSVSFCILLCLDLKSAAIKVHWKNFTPNGYYLSNIFRGGIPSLCRQGIGSISTIVLNTAAGNYGGVMADAAIAAMGVVTRIAMFANSALIGFGQGFQPVCGTNYGAGKFARVREAFVFCVKVAVVVLLVISVAGFIFAEPLMWLFRDDPDVIRIGALALRAQCITFTLNSWIIMCNMLLQTIGMALKASIVAAARQGLFLIPSLLILPLFFGLFGVQIAQTVSDILTFILAVPMGWSVIRTFKEDK